MGPLEEELIHRAQQGDREAFGILTDRYYEMVYVVAYGVLNHHETARDVTQEVFLTVFREISKFEGKSKLKTWLYRIAVNRAIDSQRRERHNVSLDRTEDDEAGEKPSLEMPDKSPGARETVFQDEMRRMIQKALKELSPEQRAVLTLREWEDLSYEEIGEALNCELGTVMSRLHYARKKLGEILKSKYKEIL